MSNFHVGQKVVCVADSIKTVNDLGLPGFKKGQIFTIAALNHREPYGLFLVFHERDKRNWGHHAGFRPVVSRGTEKGMSILREILTKTGKPVEEAA